MREDTVCYQTMSNEQSKLTVWLSLHVARSTHYTVVKTS